MRAASTGDGGRPHGGTTSGNRFAVRYYSGSKGISRSVKRGSYRVHLGAGKTKVIRVVVGATKASRKGNKRAFAITSRSAGLDTRDTVKATVKRR